VENFCFPRWWICWLWWPPAAVNRSTTPTGPRRSNLASRWRPCTRNSTCGNGGFRQMLCQTALKMAEVVERLSPRRKPVAAWLRVKIIDGTPGRTEHRIEELRTIGGGPCRARFGRPRTGSDAGDPMCFLRRWARPGAKSAAQVLPTVKARDLWIADATSALPFSVWHCGPRRHVCHSPTCSELGLRRDGRPPQSRPLSHGDGL